MLLKTNGTPGENSPGRLPRGLQQHCFLYLTTRDKNKKIKWNKICKNKLTKRYPCFELLKTLYCYREIPDSLQQRYIKWVQKTIKLSRFPVFGFKDRKQNPV